MIATALLCAVPAYALADASGGAQAPSAPLAGGSEYGIVMRSTLARPVVSELSVPATATAGRPPRVTLRIDEQGVNTVRAQVTVTSLTTHRPAIVVAMGWVHTGRAVTVVWPRKASLEPGGYQVSLAAHDHRGGTLLRRAHSSGVASVTVKAKPVAAPIPPPVPTPLAPGPPAPTPAPGAVAGGVFPVQGPHTFGGPENRFGAARAGHVHEGQDVLAAEGTPVLAPVGGTVTTAAYQAGGAGYYAVEHADDGFDFMFAHCQAGSLAVAEGQPVSAGGLVCKIGQTGDATGPHLHFEIWVGGWQAAGAHPIDPLPYLQAWDHVG